MRSMRDQALTICALICIAAAGLVSCAPIKNTGDDTSSVASFIANSSATNFIAAFLGSSQNIPGTLQDIGNITRTFNPANGFNFAMPGPDEGGWKHASQQTIIAQTAAIAGAMLERDRMAWANLQRGGTLFFYMTSHGAEDGSTIDSNNQPFFFSQVAAAIKQARQGHPLERLIVMFDTCFSGQNVVGAQAINQNTGSGGMNPFGGYGLQGASMETEQMIFSVANSLSSGQGLYKSGIFIGASRPDETSGDAPNGGVGTQALLAAVAAAKMGSTMPSNPNDFSGFLNNFSNMNGVNRVPNTLPAQAAGPANMATIRGVLNNMVAGASGQQPVWCVEPQELADDTFFDLPPGFLPPVISDASLTRTRVCNTTNNGMVNRPNMYGQ